MNSGHSMVWKLGHPPSLWESWDPCCWEQSQMKAVKQKADSDLMFRTHAYERWPHFQPLDHFCLAAVLCKIQSFLGKPRIPVAGGSKLFSSPGEEVASYHPQPHDLGYVSQMHKQFLTTYQPMPSQSLSSGCSPGQLPIIFQVFFFFCMLSYGME